MDSDSDVQFDEETLPYGNLPSSPVQYPMQSCPAPQFDEEPLARALVHLGVALALALGVALALTLGVALALALGVALALALGMSSSWPNSGRVDGWYRSYSRTEGQC